MRDLGENFVGHAPCERAIADDSDHISVLPLAQSRLSDAECVAQRGRGMAVLHQVMLGFLPRWITRHATRLTQPGELTSAAGDDLVHVRLMAGVPHDRVLGAVELAAKRERPPAAAGGGGGDTPRP